MKLLFLLFVCLLTGCSSKDPSDKKKVSGVSDIPCQVIENVIEGDGAPALVIYLHSRSGSGTDNKKQMTQESVINIENYIKDNNISAYFLVPQCPVDYEWDSRGSTSGYYGKAKELLDNFLAEKDVDRNRIYICGTSMGAMGTWRMLREYPDFFAAAIVGSGQPQFDLPWLYVYLPLYITAGTEERSYEALKDFAEEIAISGGDARFEKLEGMTHGMACDNACNEKRLKWLFSQKKNIE